MGCASYYSGKNSYSCNDLHNNTSHPGRSSGGYAPASGDTGHHSIHPRHGTSGRLFLHGLHIHLRGEPGNNIHHQVFDRFYKR